MHAKENAVETRRGATWIGALAAALALAATPAWSQPDLQITALSVQGTARVGGCNTLSMTVRNTGNQFANTATLDIFVATYTQGSPFQNRSEKSLFISPIQPGQESTFPVTNVTFAAAGAMTVQALVDSTQEVAESNENNNTSLLNVTVSGNCLGTPTPPPPPPASACDLSAKFTAPTGTSVSGPDIAFEVLFENKSKAACPANKIKLMRYSSSTCSGYGSQVGGSGALQALQALAPGAAQEMTWVDKKVSRGRYCYKIVYSSPHNDANNGNHHPQKPLNVQ